MYGAKSALNVYRCGSWTEKEILSDAACTHGRRNTIFVTLKYKQHVRFEQAGAFPEPPLPSGVHPIRGPLRYGMLGVHGDPFDLEAGECLTA